jgi:hypothetical protein
LVNMLIKKFPHRLIHMEEIWYMLRATVTNMTNEPEYSGEIFGNIVTRNRQDINAKRSHKSAKKSTAKGKNLF